ncbi:tyrosine--tRNA ligase [Luoshenia tenuis]|jgi:tyrosyl-tRNA synthetase|uniref:tyrosine--tRNA ligase n=1 Tax=Luoshenia tenuis TaxID=2763654 RepID=UPI003D92AC47
MHVMDTLKERGFIQQVTHEEDLYRLFDREQVTFYNGFDPTADSLHVGHYIPVMAMAHLQRAGHRPIALVGGGTAMVGDPSGKSDMRKMMTRQIVDHNAACMKKQLSKFLDFGEGKAFVVDNADWLLNLNYVEFLRDIGVHFSVNRMLTAECFKQRLERGLSFLEFNYMLMQSYDFLVLYQKYGCKLQTGGDDQWSNMLYGADLVRRKEQGEAFALTFSLLTNSQGVKMGKTVAGALWLDPAKCSAYDFYQYWRNVDDRDVEKCLALLTFMPMEEVRRLGSYQDEKINEAKRIMAYEITRIIHGDEAAKQAQDAAEALFGGGADGGSIPTSHITCEIFENNRRVIDLLALCGLCKSKGEARRLIAGGGVKIEGEKVADVEQEVDPNRYDARTFTLQKGKKGFHRFVVTED